MPPKKQQKASNKTEQKRKDKVIEDKTFGLKNKKGTKQQKFVKHVNQQVKQGGDPNARKMEQQRLEEKKRKELDKIKQAEIEGLFRPVVVQKVAKDVDPKSVLCAFFKQGLCQKGDRCKFSHDMSIERKGEKRSMYADERDEDLSNDTIDQWDEDKLKKVVEKKHGEGNKQRTKTDIVCKYFIQAIEEKKYGWFWTCPNGGNTCIYRHALPPGFVLKSDRKKMEEQKEQISIEELIEKERAALGSKVTKVTLETFLAWKKRKKEEKIKSLKAKKDKRQKDFRAGKLFGVSGREMFEFEPNMAVEDDDEADDVRYGADVDDAEIRGVSTTMFVPEEVDGSGTRAASDRLQAKPDQNGDEKVVAENPEAEAEVPTSSKCAEVDAVPVDENLFTEDLDDLECELDELDV